MKSVYLDLLKIALLNYSSLENELSVGFRWQLKGDLIVKIGEMIIHSSS